ncbi:DUF5999 family protein [Streptomyces sp. 5.8]|uniref:DUF5999 family protein n=1 Tax=Streptomyces sp. 5.8 TaxID=3406571 RepID=UPI003BB4A891
MEQTPTPTCPHSPRCPRAEDGCRGEARIVAAHPEQGWNLLCNGVLDFEDTGQLLPDGTTVAPHRPTGLERVAA